MSQRILSWELKQGKKCKVVTNFNFPLNTLRTLWRNPNSSWKNEQNSPRCYLVGLMKYLQALLASFGHYVPLRKQSVRSCSWKWNSPKVWVTSPSLHCPHRTGGVSRGRVWPSRSRERSWKMYRCNSSDISLLAVILPAPGEDQTRKSTGQES